MSEEELKLISKLKENYKTYEFFDGTECKPLARENYKQSSEIFHKLGLIYKKRNSSKICLIQSAALFAAARIRNPGQKTIIEDFEKLWHMILCEAAARNKDFCLNHISRSLKNDIRFMRQIKRRVNQLPQLKFNMPALTLRRMENRCY